MIVKVELVMMCTVEGCPTNWVKCQDTHCHIFTCVLFARERWCWCRKTKYFHHGALQWSEKTSEGRYVLDNCKPLKVQCLTSAHQPASHCLVTDSCCVHMLNLRRAAYTYFPLNILCRLSVTYIRTSLNLLDCQIKPASLELNYMLYHLQWLSFVVVKKRVLLFSLTPCLVWKLWVDLESKYILFTVQ